MVAVIASLFASLLGQADEFVRPAIDWHAVAPELVLVVGRPWSRELVLVEETEFHRAP